MQDTELFPKHQVTDLHQRVGRLEAGYDLLTSNHSKLSTDLALMKLDITYIKAGQDKVTQGINRIFWAIGLSAIGAATTFILAGGLVVGP